MHIGIISHALYGMEIDKGLDEQRFQFACLASCRAKRKTMPIKRAKRAKAKCLKHSTSDNKHSFFFPSNPLDNLLCRFGHSLSTRPSACNAIKLILLGFPPERDRIFRTSIVHLEMCGFVVDSSVQSRIQRYQTAMGHERGKVWVEGGSEELDVRAGFVDEVEEG